MLVTAANIIVFWALASAAADGRINLGEIVIYAQCAVGTSLIAFGGLNWALDGAAAPVAAVGRLAAGDGVRRAARLRSRVVRPPACRRGRSASTTFRLPTLAAPPCSTASTLQFQQVRRSQS